MMRTNQATANYAQYLGKKSRKLFFVCFSPPDGQNNKTETRSIMMFNLSFVICERFPAVGMF